MECHRYELFSASRSAQKARSPRAQACLGSEREAALDHRQRLVPAAGGKFDVREQRQKRGLLHPGPDIGVSAEAGASRGGERRAQAYARPIGVGRRDRSPELQIVLVCEYAHVLGGGQNLCGLAAESANQKAIVARRRIGRWLSGVLRAPNRLVRETLGLLGSPSHQATWPRYASGFDLKSRAKAVRKLSSRSSS